MKGVSLLLLGGLEGGGGVYICAGYGGWFGFGEGKEKEKEKEKDYMAKMG